LASARVSKDGAETARGCVLICVASEIAHMTEPVAIVLSDNDVRTLLDHIVVTLWTSGRYGEASHAA
jgi:hypothetical protein